MAVTPEIGVGNLELQQQLNNLIAERTKILEQHNAIMTSHNQLIAAMSSKLKEQQDAAGGAAKANTDVNKSLEEVTKSSKTATSTIGTLGSSFKKLSSVTGSAWSGLKKFGGMLKSVASASFGAVGFVAKFAMRFAELGKAIVAFPFAMLNGFIGMANSLPSGPSPIALQIEEIRKAFGDVSANEGKLVKSSLEAVRGEMHNFAGTGLSVARMFGYGPEGIAAAMKEFQAIAESLGPSLNRLQDDIKGNIPELLALTRGFTGSADATAAMLKHAKSLGKDGTQEIIHATSMAQRMGKQYGINSKIIGKSVGEMSKDISNFGSMSTKQMTAASVYTSKLGIEIQDLSNVMNKFLNFEDAAKGAAEMAQAFGMNVDTMELMKGGPEAIEAMRKAFFASGKSIESLSNAERKLLEQQTGLAGASLEAAFAASSQGTAYDEIAASAEDAGSIQERQIDVMKELAKSIDRVFGSGGDTFSSFGDAMTKGFTDGFMRAKPMYELLRNIRRSLRATYLIFRDIGKQFVTSFPGLQKFLTSLSKIFNPAGISVLMRNFGENLSKLMSDISNPNKKDSAVAKFLDNIKKSFSNFFSKNGAAAKGVVSGGKTILSTVWSIFSQLLTVGIDQITKGIEAFLQSDFIKTLAGGIQGAGSALGSAFGRLWDSLGKAWDTIWPLLEPKLSALGTWLKEKFMSLLGSLFSADTAGLVSSAAGLFSGPVGIGVAGAMAAGLTPVLTGALKDVVKSAFSAVFSSVDKDVGKDNSADAVKKAAEQAEAVSAKGIDWKSAAAKVVGVVVFVGAMLALMPLFIEYLKYIAPKLAGLKISDIAMSALVMTVAIGMFIGAMAVIKKLSAATKVPIGVGTIIKGVIGIGAVVVVAAGTALLVSKVLNGINGEDLKKKSDALDGLVMMGIKMAAAGALLGIALTNPISAAVVAAGILALGAVILATVEALTPVIKILASIKIENPVIFEKVSKTIIGLANVGANLASAVGSIMESLPKPDWFSDAEDDSRMFKDSMTIVNDMIKNLTAPIDKAKETITSVLSQLGNVDEQKVKVVTGLIGSILPPLFNFMGTSAKVFSEIAKNATDSEGNISTSKIQHMVTAFSSITKSLFSADLITNINDTITTMLSAVESLVIPKSFNQKARVIESVMSMLSTFISMGSTVIGLMKERPIENESSGISSLESMDLTQIFGVLQKIAESIPDNMKTIVGGMAKLLELPILGQYGAKGKMETLKVMLDTATGFINALTGISVDDGTLNKVHDSMTILFNTFSYDFKLYNQLEAILAGVGSLALLGKDIVGFNQTDAKRLTDVFYSAADLVKNISGSGEENLAGKITLGLSNANVLFLNPTLPDLITKLGQISNSAKGINTDGLGNLSTVAEKASELGKILANFVGALPLDSFELSNLIYSYVDGINSIVNVGETFANSKSFDALVQLTDTLGKSQTVTVDAQGVTYSLSVTVSIDAEKLAENLVKTGKLKETLGLK